MNPILTAILVVSAIGIIAAVLLCLASKYMNVPVDEKFPKIRECLPGANCGGCGFAGCDGYANALAKGEITETDKCTAGGNETAKALAEVMGTEFSETKKRTAYVFCKGDCNATDRKTVYMGDRSCKSAALLYGGDGLCFYGCLGYGDCVNACPNHAIHVVNQVAVVQTSACIGCGLCEKTCPKHVIHMVTDVHAMRVLCSNPDKGPATKKVCHAGCLGCGICVKKCEQGAITLKGNVAVIDEEKCIACSACAVACPVKCIQ